MPIFALRAVFAAVCCLCISSAQAGLFEDDEARRAILDLRQKVEQMQQQGVQLQQQSAQMQQQSAEQLRAAKNENAVSIEQVNGQLTQLRRSLLELSNMIESLRPAHAIAPQFAGALQHDRESAQ